MALLNEFEPDPNFDNNDKILCRDPQIEVLVDFFYSNINNKNSKDLCNFLDIVGPTGTGKTFVTTTILKKLTLANMNCDYDILNSNSVDVSDIDKISLLLKQTLSSSQKKIFYIIDEYDTLSCKDKISRCLFALVEKHFQNLFFILISNYDKIDNSIIINCNKTILTFPAYSIEDFIAIFNQRRIIFEKKLKKMKIEKNKKRKRNSRTKNPLNDTNLNDFFLKLNDNLSTIDTNIVALAASSGGDVRIFLKKVTQLLKNTTNNIEYTDTNDDENDIKNVVFSIIKDYFNKNPTEGTITAKTLLQFYNNSDNINSFSMSELKNILDELCNSGLLQEVNKIFYKIY